MVFDLAQKTADYLGTGIKIEREKVRAICDYVGPGYGLPTNGMIKAVKLLAQTEGLLFDPVYSGKGLDGLIDQIKRVILQEWTMLCSCILVGAPHYLDTQKHLSYLDTQINYY